MTLNENKTIPDTTPDLRRVYTMPEKRTVEPSNKDVLLLPHSQSDTTTATTFRQHQLDRFGFILNMDSHGNIHPIETAAAENDEIIPTFYETQLKERRLLKWDKMMTVWGTTLMRKRKLVLRRLRKGLPDSIRGHVWTRLGNVDTKIQQYAGLYDKLVRQTIIEPAEVQENIIVNDNKHTKSFRNLQDTIERDIHRTFPRHSMFYDDADSDAPDHTGLCGTTEISTMIRELELTNGLKGRKAANLAGSIGGRASPQNVLESKGGQASLRRVLKAYSLYDRDIGYCQGMNFIAGMFLTLMSEEEAFWLLVYTMHDKPCQMRGLFAEGMRETHRCLYVAEKLIQQFLPKLSKHLEREHIHITMFATQWLLTQYTSSFHFDLVTRVWDTFLFEGWKITYRMMLALLSQSQSSLLKMSFEEILSFFRDLPNRVEGAPLMEAAMKIPLRRKQIARYEKEWDVQQAHQRSEQQQQQQHS